MPPYVDNTVTLENVRIMWRNFEGRGDKFNREGDRNFAIILDDETAELMLHDGWAIKRLKAREGDEEEPPYFMKVTAKMDGRKPARLVMITKRNRTVLDEESAELLDWAELDNVDLRIRPYDWEVNGNTGRKAYLVSIYAKIYEDYLEEKYAHLDVVNANAPLALPAGPSDGLPVLDGEVISDSFDEPRMHELMNKRNLTEEEMDELDRWAEYNDAQTSPRERRMLTA